MSGCCDRILTLATGIGGSATGLSRMVSEDLHQQGVLTLLVLVDNCVVQGILVLLQPSGDVVGHLGTMRVFGKEVSCVDKWKVYID